ncbi:hypothetical protein CC85DRAFT_288414 [Cutaneotrichosporon oleaginosum]|uniref:LysM domain-containing protein n=1 Tax=Cutaneotrichosporon oleaginosum TaxID=879819 RepID=A0A0J0XER5_9TREE|nr:uncharacterized protein CC85DRAFT_288414 [Cutaneotrichosporon oleaginosum]KLT39556.1 hypothetical protein CC85DRAFT_288414 [Cutaneotrichosporon oleaginosum]TXT08015.1 hypothetical protein COLE_04939 [Cutaneotrichosporon oleaginosum]
MRDAHDDVDPWADAEEVDLGHDQPPAPPVRPSQSQRKAKPFKTTPLTSLPAKRDLGDGEGPRRRSSYAASDASEPYAVASGSAYSGSPSRSTSHPLELDMHLKTPPEKGKGRARSSSGPSPLSPLGASLSPLSASTSPSISASRQRAPQSLALAGLGGLGGNSLSDFRDVSRPGLARATSETERAASVGSWSATNSDFGEDDSELVDVIVHAVGGGESLAGIALRYGIELSVLRKANKLWPSDPLLRSQLFVPLESCKATADSWIERHEEEVVLVRRRKRRRGSGSGTASPTSPRTLSSEPSTPRGEPPRLPDAPGSPRRSEEPKTREELERIPLEVARISASQLRFFPHRPNRGRSSLEDRRMTTDNARRPRGLFAALTLADSDDEYEPRAPHRVTVRSGAYAEPPTSPKKEERKEKPKEKRKNKVVRLRPPVAQPPPPPNAGIASRIQNFFSVPPPPTNLPAPALPPAERSNGEERVRSPELVEMDSAPPRRTDKKRD